MRNAEADYASALPPEVSNQLIQNILVLKQAFDHLVAKAEDYQKDQRSSMTVHQCVQIWVPFWTRQQFPLRQSGTGVTSLCCLLQTARTLTYDRLGHSLVLKAPLVKKLQFNQRKTQSTRST